MTHSNTNIVQRLHRTSSSPPTTSLPTSTWGQVERSRLRARCLQRTLGSSTVPSTQRPMRGFTHSNELSLRSVQSIDHTLLPINHFVSMFVGTLLAFILFHCRSCCGHDISPSRARALASFTSQAIFFHPVCTPACFSCLLCFNPALLLILFLGNPFILPGPRLERLVWGSRCLRPPSLSCGVVLHRRRDRL